MIVLDLVGRDDLKRKKEANQRSLLEDARKIRRYNKIDVHKRNVHNSANEHETRKSENTKEEEDMECIFHQETFLNSAGGERLVHCMSPSKWAHTGVL